MTSPLFRHILLIGSESGSGGVARWLEYLLDMSEALGHWEGEGGESVGPSALRGIGMTQGETVRQESLGVTLALPIRGQLKFGKSSDLCRVTQQLEGV